MLDLEMLDKERERAGISRINSAFGCDLPSFDSGWDCAILKVTPIVESLERELKVAREEATPANLGYLKAVEGSAGRHKERADLAEKKLNIALKAMTSVVITKPFDAQTSPAVFTTLQEALSKIQSLGTTEEAGK